MDSVRVTIVSAVAALVLAPCIAGQAPIAVGGGAGNGSTSQVTDPIWEQADDCTGNGGPSQVFPDLNEIMQSADDFVLIGPESLKEVVACGAFNGTACVMESVTVEIYDVDGPAGLPGTLLCAVTGLQSANGPLDPNIHVTLDGSCALSTGRGWLSVMVVMPLSEGLCQWFWITNDSANESEFVFRDPADLLGNGVCADWGLGRSECGLNTTFSDLGFEIGGAGGDGGDGGGVPAVGATGVIVLVLILMVVSFLYLRRYRTT